MLRGRLPYNSESITARTGGSYDLGGVWRPALTGPSTVHFNKHAYNQHVHAPYYVIEDDYYGAYGDLLEFERNLRFDRQMSEQERLERWRLRLAFEELEDHERMRRYQLMDHAERVMLGLAENSWWDGRYGHHDHHHGHHRQNDWRARFGNELPRWGSDMLPLTSRLTSWFSPVWSSASERLAQTERRLDDQFDRMEDRLDYDRAVDAGRRLSREIREEELYRREAEIAGEERYLQDRRLEEEARFERERCLENRLENEIVYDQERRLDGRLEDMHDQERRLDALQFENGALRRAEDRLENEAYMDGLLREQAIYERERGFDDGFDDTLQSEAVRNEILMDRDEYATRDLLY